MKKFSAKEAKDGFGLLIDTAQREPIQIEKKGRPVAVILSMEEYKKLQMLEDLWWKNEAMKAIKEGFLGTKESEKLLLELLNAKD